LHRQRDYAVPVLTRRQGVPVEKKGLLNIEAMDNLKGPLVKRPEGLLFSLSIEGDH